MLDRDGWADNARGGEPASDYTLSVADHVRIAMEAWEQILALPCVARARPWAGTEPDVIWNMSLKCLGRYRIDMLPRPTIEFGLHSHGFALVATMAHEAAHWLCGRPGYARQRQCHGAAFERALRTIAAEAWNVAPAELGTNMLSSARLTWDRIAHRFVASGSTRYNLLDTALEMALHDRGVGK